MIDLGGMDDFDEVMEEEMCDLEIERDDFNDRVFKAWKLQQQKMEKERTERKKRCRRVFWNDLLSCKNLC